MTLPDERYRALINTRDFMRSLLDRLATPRVPLVIRRQARSCLKHYPWESDLEKLASSEPGILQAPRHKKKGTS